MKVPYNKSKTVKKLSNLGVEGQDSYKVHIIWISDKSPSRSGIAGSNFSEIVPGSYKKVFMKKILRVEVKQ